MDLAGVQGRLNALGVTLEFEDDPPAQAAALVLQRQYRAALYIRRLEEVRDFLTNPAVAGSPAGPVVAGQNGLGPEYRFAQAALTSGALLNDLAETYDKWICYAVWLAIRAAALGTPRAYEDWFTNRIYDANLATFDQNVADFATVDYPITGHALTQITNYFQTNIATAARRIVDDRLAIAALFSDLYYPGLTLNALTAIRSTGSDFHKGGLQVLVLTFTVAAFYGYGIPSELKLIYKPTDMELDCLIAGNSAAVRRAIPRANPAAPEFLDDSLVELFNTAATANPGVGAEPLPTYRILPRNRTSTTVAPPLAIRQAYGYVEYLGFSLTGDSWTAFNYYPFATSDYVIFPRTPTAPVLARFYHQMGQLLALAAIFSLTDLHVENVRVRGYAPYLIDLEAALTKPVADIYATDLLLNVNGNILGGINGWRTDTSINWFVNRNNRADLNPLPVMKTNANRLVRLTAAGARNVIRVDPFLLREGLDRGLAVLAALQLPPNTAAAWFVRAQNVLLRLLPVGTTAWTRALRGVYEDQNDINPLAPRAGVIDDEVRNVVTIEHGNYPGVPAPPEYLPPAAPQATTDLDNFDIPVFYTRLGAVDILDSMGVVFPMPATVAMLPPASLPVPSGFGPGGARLTYFAPPGPATAQNQLAALPGGIAATRLAFTNQIVQHLGIGAMPLAPAVVL